MFHISVNPRSFKGFPLSKVISPIGHVNLMARQTHDIGSIYKRFIGFTQRYHLNTMTTYFLKPRALSNKLFATLLLSAYAVHEISAADGDHCQYNDVQGYCVTADANHHNAQCHADRGWLQFYMGTPLPRLYTGCGDDGVVQHLILMRVVIDIQFSMLAAFQLSALCHKMGLRGVLQPIATALTIGGSMMSLYVRTCP